MKPESRLSSEQGLASAVNLAGPLITSSPRHPWLRGCLKSRLRVTDHRRVMPITISTDKLYDTDLTDAAWALIGPMLPAARRGGRPRTTNIRAVLTPHSGGHLRAAHRM